MKPITLGIVSVLMLGIAIIACLSPIVACDCCPQQAVNHYDTVAQSYVGIAREDKGSVGGAGICVEFMDKRAVLTAGHCAEEDTKVLYVVHDEKYHEAKVIARSEKPDLCLLEDPKLDRVYVTRYTVGVNVGEDVLGYGSPGGYGQMLMKGYVCKDVTDHPHSRMFFVVTGRAYYGDSGSGVFAMRNGKPHLAGVLVMIAWKGLAPPAGMIDGESVVVFLRTHMGPSQP